MSCPFQGIEGSGHGNDLVIVGRFGSPGALGAKVVELGLGHSHEGLVGQGHELPVEVVFMHPVDVTLEVVARDNLVGQDEDPDWVVCWVRYTHSGNYEARGASGDYEARGASGDYEAWRASGGKYEARMVIFRILAAVNRFSRISWKEESR